jgi:MFS transporter, DHA3 family, macrolide efflux protein
MPALGVFLGLVLGLLAGGKLDNFFNVRLRWLPLLFAAAIARLGLDAALASGDIPDGLRLGLVLVIYFLLIVVLVANRSLPGMTAAALGTAANGIAIVANGGWMPVWRPSLVAAGLNPDTFHSNFHRLLVGPVDASFFAHGGPLVDIIPIPIPLPGIQSVASIGDLLLGAGLAAFVFASLVRSPALAPATASASIPAVRVEAPTWPAPTMGVRGYSYVRLATNGAFSAMFISQVVSSLGDRVHQVALVFLVAGATNNSPLALGLVFAAMTVPTSLIGPLAGALVDRWDRKWVMVASDLLRAGIVCLIPAASGIHVGIVVGLVFALAAVSSFFRPARAAALPQVVPEEDLLSANSAMWVADTVSDLAGYGLGGLFVAFLGSSLALAFWLDGVSYLASAALVAAVVIPPIVRGAAAAEGTGGVAAAGGAGAAGVGVAAAGGAGAAGVGVAAAGGAGAASVPVTTSIREEMAQGWRFLRTESVLLATTIQAAIAEYGLGALTALSPLFIAALALGSTDAPTAYGFFEMAMGAGLVVGGVVLGGLAARLPKGPAIIAAFTALGIALVALSLTASLWVALALAAGIGLANVTFVVPSQTLFQQRTPGELLGRVVAIRLALVNGALAVSMATSGALAEAFGVRPVLAACGLLTAAVGLAGLAVRPIRRA